VSKVILFLGSLIYSSLSLSANVKFYCFQSPGMGRAIFEAGYRDCQQKPNGPSTTPVPSHVCIQSAYCLVPSENDKKVIAANGEKSFDQMSVREIESSIRKTAEATYNPVTKEANFMGKLQHLFVQSTRPAFVRSPNSVSRTCITIWYRVDQF